MKSSIVTQSCVTLRKFEFKNKNCYTRHASNFFMRLLIVGWNEAGKSGFFSKLKY